MTKDTTPQFKEPSEFNERPHLAEQAEAGVGLSSQVVEQDSCEPAVAGPGASLGQPVVFQRCTECGTRFTSSDARFCPYDGTSLEAGAQAQTQDSLIGRVLVERYEIMELLGEGGMGSVYRARHVVLGKHFAIKALREGLAFDADLAQRFVREAKAAARINHPNVVQIIDFGELPGGRPFFVMELLEGESLSAVIKREGPLAVERAVSIAREVAQALACAHEQQVIHRDLKPDNIYLLQRDDGSERVKVLDFGLAKVAGQSRLTRRGVVFGTPQYMSPEQASGGLVDHLCDVYSLGIVLYEMLTARVPFEADSYMGVLTKHMYVAPEPPSCFLPDGEPLGVLEDVVLRCLAKNPEKRYESMPALVLALSAVSADPGQRTLDAKDARRQEHLASGLFSTTALREPVRNVLSRELAAFGSGEHGGLEHPRKPGLRGKLFMVLGIVCVLLPVVLWAFRFRHSARTEKPKPSPQTAIDSRPVTHGSRAEAPSTPVTDVVSATRAGNSPMPAESTKQITKKDVEPKGELVGRPSSGGKSQKSRPQRSTPGARSAAPSASEPIQLGSSELVNPWQD